MSLSGRYGNYNQYWKILCSGVGWQGSQVCGGDHVDAHGGRARGGEQLVNRDLILERSVLLIRSVREPAGAGLFCWSRSR